MVYVALLRGINVGGDNIIAMPKLKATFERLGLSDVKTYINSGNIIFREATRSQTELVKIIEQAIAEDFGLSIKVLLRNRDNIQVVERALPASWTNDQTMKCDVLFLWEDIDSSEIVKQLVIKPDIEDVTYVKGALLWRIDRENATKSGLLKLVGTEPYKMMTVRNANTLRKLAALMSSYK